MEKKTYSLVYRVIHWSIAFSMLFLLLTIALRMNWMNKNNMAGIIESFLKETNVNLSEDDIITLAKKIRKPMWEWHMFTGYVLVALFTIRFTLPFFGEMKFQWPKQATSKKDKFKSWVYIIFYVCVTVSLSTGLMIEFGPDSLHELMEEVHILSLYYFVTYLIIHFTGVLIADFREDKGIISKIIGGGKS